jgi:membrane protein DedA with SNARE-associated domain
MPNFLAGHEALASFVWGLFKSLLPLPSPSGFVLLAAEIVRPAAGAAAAAGRLTTRLVLPGAAGMAIGAAPYYLWARRAGRDAVERWGPIIGISRKRVQDFERRAGRRRELVVWGLFALPLSPILLGAVAAGLLELEPGPYAVASLAGALCRCGLLGAAGYVFRANLGNPVRWVDTRGLASGLIAAGLAALWILRRRRKNLAS